jgi:glycosyltransferase involved in cell wall biosynthesis
MLINHYAGTPKMGMEYRPYYMAQEWIKQGHQVVIIAADNAHVRTIQPTLSSHPIKEENIDGIQYIWIKTPTYSGNGIKRILNMRSFVKRVKNKAKHFAETYKPEVVIASSTYPMDNYAAHKIAKLSNAKYVYEVHDLWPLSPMELGGYKASHPYIKYLQKAEDFAYRNADKLISMLPMTKEYMMSRGLKEEKWFYVPNGILVENKENDKDLDENLVNAIQLLRSKHKFSLIYTGSHGIANALDSFLEAAKQKKDVAFVLFGDGPEKKALINKFDNLSNVYFFNSVPKTQINKLLSYFDATYIGLKNQSLFRFGVSPNKLFDYMMAGKPIIQALNAGNNIVKEANCGISIPAENKEELLSAIDKMQGMSEEDRKTLGKNGQNYVVKNHNYSVLATKCIEILK